ncbi:fibrous sheath-interacting protein 2-like [Ambystoma mexicanum]|uniref:fibrous sheath-interacting protein 2-like n=1 Tax=Ambystoma mexicanum TaxID=8296 RepID=UPI0037E985A6
MNLRLPEDEHFESPRASGDGSNAIPGPAAFKMSNMPLGMKLPVITCCDYLLQASELCEQGYVKYDENDKNLLKKQNGHNIEVPTSAIFMDVMDKVKFESACLFSHTISDVQHNKIKDGRDVNASDGETCTVSENKYSTSSSRRKMQPPIFATGLSSKNRSLLAYPYQKNSPFGKRKKVHNKISSLQTLSTFKTCKVYKEKAPIRKQIKSQSAPNLTRKDTPSLNYPWTPPESAGLDPEMPGAPISTQLGSLELSCNVPMNTSADSVSHPKPLEGPSEYETKHQLLQSCSIPKHLCGQGTTADDHSVMNNRDIDIIEANNTVFNFAKSELTLLSEEIVENVFKKILADHSYSLYSASKSPNLTEKLKKGGKAIKCAPLDENPNIEKVVCSVHNNVFQESESQIVRYTHLTSDCTRSADIKSSFKLKEMSNNTLEVEGVTEELQTVFCTGAEVVDPLKVMNNVPVTKNQWFSSALSKTLSSNNIYIADNINNQIANISSSNTIIEAHPEDNSIVSAVEINKTLTGFRCTGNHVISYDASWNTNNSNGKQCSQANVDIPQVAESVYRNILQSYKTQEAIQSALVSCPGTILDKIANTIIVEMTHHLQPILSGQESAENIVEEVLEDIAAHPHRSSPEPGEGFPFKAVYSASFLEDVLSGLLHKIVSTSTTMYAKNQKVLKSNISEKATQLVYPLVREINRAQIKVIELKEDTCDHSTRHDVDRVVDSIYHYFLKLYGCYLSVQKDIKCVSSTLTKRLVSLLLVEINDYQLDYSHFIEQPPHLYKTLDAENIAHKVRCLFTTRPQDRPLSPTTTVLSSKVLEDIIITLMAKMLSSANIKKCKDTQRSLSDAELNEMTSKFVQDVMMKISGHEIWYTKDATFIQRVPVLNNQPNRDDSVHSNVIRTYGPAIKVPDNELTGNKYILKKTPRLLFREISNPNFMAFQSDESSSCSYSWTSDSSVAEQILGEMDSSEGHGHASYHMFVYSSSFLEEIISGISSLIFFAVSDHIRKEKCPRSEAQLNNLASTFVRCLLREIENAQVKVANISEEKYKFPEIHKHAVDSITKLVFNNIYQEYENDSAVYKCLTQSCSVFAGKIVHLILMAISDYHLQCPVTDDVSVLAYSTLDAKNIVPKVVSSVMETSNLGKSSVTFKCKARSTTSVRAASVVETVFDDITHPYDESDTLQPCVTVLSSIILEEIVAKFLSKLFFHCPNLNMCSKDVSSVSQVKKITEKLLKALYITISEKQIQISQDMNETRYVHPKDDEVIEKVVTAVYSDVYQLSDSHLSIFQNLTREGDVLAHIVASLMIAEICNCQFQPCCAYGKLSDKYIGIESTYIVQRVLNDIRGMPPHSPLLDNSSHGLYAPFLEEIVSQFLTKMFISSNFGQTARAKTNSGEVELSKIASRLINSVLKELLKSEINVIKPPHEGQCLHTEDEDFVAIVVDSVYINALHESGSPLKLFKAITSGCTVVSERIASLVMKEISKYQLQPFLASGVSCESYTDIEVSKIVEKVLNDVAAQSSLNSNAEDIVHSITDKLLECEADNLPIIVPHWKHIPMEIDSGIVAMHLAVLSIKTKPIEILENVSLLQSGQTLARLRRISIYGKSALDIACDAQPLSPEFELESEDQRRGSLDIFGRLDIKPKKLVSRNSFFNVLKPDITTVELLKDVKTKHELIVRLVAHDIVHPDDDEFEDFDEIVINEDSCLEGPQPSKTQLLMDKLNKKKCCSCCCRDSTKTVDSVQKPPTTDPNLDHGDSIANMPSQHHFEKAGHPCTYEDIELYRFEKMRNCNANSATCALNDRLDKDYGSHVQNSFLPHSCLQNHRSESPDGTFSPIASTHILPHSSISMVIQPYPPYSCVGNGRHPPLRRRFIRCRHTPQESKIGSVQNKCAHSSISLLFQPYPLSSRTGNKRHPTIRRKPLRYTRTTLGGKTSTGWLKPNKDSEQLLNDILHLPPVSSSAQQTRKLCVFPGMSAAFARLFSRKCTSGSTIKDEQR